MTQNSELKPMEFFRHALGAEELASVEQTLGSVFITLGPRVGEFEQRFAEYLGVPHVVGISSCSVGLILALKLFDIGPGDEVITTPMTFVATPNAALHVGATPVFVDVEPNTALIDPARVEAAITDKTKAIIAVHLYGELCDMKALRAIADKHGLRLIEDAAHAVESERDGVRTAQLGDATAFSFYATKNLTCGDGGALAVHDPALVDTLKRWRNHGITKDAASRYGQRYTHWDMVELGYKCALTDLQAALLLPQLPLIEERRDLREALVSRYRELLANTPEVMLLDRVGKSAQHLFPVFVPSDLRDAVLSELGARKVGCTVNYRSIHTLSFYRDRYELKRGDFPVSADLGDRTISLPLFPTMPLTNVDVVVERLREALTAARSSS